MIMSLKQSEIKIKPRIKLNHNTTTCHKEAATYPKHQTFSSQVTTV